MLLLSTALKEVAACKGCEGEKTSSSGCSQRKRPEIFGSKETYSVESHWFSRESLTKGLSKRKVRFPSWGTSCFALVKSKLTVLRLQADKKIIPHIAEVNHTVLIRIKRSG